MAFRIFVMFAVLLTYSRANANEEEEEESERNLSKLINEFNFDLEKCNSGDNNANTVYSPYSIYLAMAMLHLGSKGSTKDELSDAMKWKVDENHFNVLKKMVEGFRNNNTDVKLNVANNGWVASDMELLDDYQRKMDDYFGVEFEHEDFKNASNARDNINQWVSNHTGKRIQELFPAGSFNTMTKLVLANAVYFKGAWKMPFKKKYTKADKFTREDGRIVEGVDYMFQNAKFATGIHRNVELLEMPYGQEDTFTMFFAKPRDTSTVYQYEEKPDDITDISKLTNDMDESLLREMLGSLQSEKTDIFVPKFTVRKTFPLIDALKCLGVRDIFSPQKADLSCITGEKNLFVSSAQHEAFIEVDEEGTKASGATGVGISYMSMSPQFRLDRPFLFFILYKKTNTTIFAGKMMEPDV